MPISISTLVPTEMQLTQSTFALTGVTVLGAKILEWNTKDGMGVTKFHHRSFVQRVRNRFRTHREGKTKWITYISDYAKGAEWLQR